MFLGLCWFALLLAQSVSFQPSKRPQARKRAEECIPSIKERIKQCFQLGKVVQLQTFECYDVNSQGGCDEGERLVIIRESECGATKCVKNIADGRPCSDELFAYNGGCENSGSKSACQDKGVGKRLTADLFGTEVACRCAADLGYVDVNGECHHEYFRGPCQEGEQILRDGTHNWKCIRHYCDQGQVQWADGRCYDVMENLDDVPCDDVYDLETKSEEETVEVAEDQNVEDLLILSCKSAETRSGTFDNCVARRKNSDECLATGRIPQVDMQDLNSYLRNLLSTINIEKH